MDALNVLLECSTRVPVKLVVAILILLFLRIQFAQLVTFLAMAAQALPWATARSVTMAISTTPTIVLAPVLMELHPFSIHKVAPVKETAPHAKILQPTA